MHFNYKAFAKDLGTDGMVAVVQMWIRFNLFRTEFRQRLL